MSGGRRNRIDLWSFWAAYSWLLHELLRSPIETNERTRTRVHVLPGGASFGIDLSDGLMPTCGLRKTFPRVAAAEVAWYVSGDRDATWMTAQAPIWDKFVEPLERLRLTLDGHPYNETFEGVAAAYGYRWRTHFGRDQLADAVEALRRDPSNRRVVVSAWDPASDGLLSEGQKNVPCPAMFTLSISGGELHSTMLLRSSDVFVGLPYDVLGHALLLAAVAAELGVKLGVAHFTLAHAHLYEPHWEMALKAVGQQPVVPEVALPSWTLSQVRADRDGYVALVREACKPHAWPEYNPKPEVVA